MTTTQNARTPEDLTRLFVDRASAGDADGLAALYAPDAVLAYPPGSVTTGRDAIRGVLTQCSHARRGRSRKKIRLRRCRTAILR